MNILFLFADQMHRYALGCMGNADIHTPNLDRLAAAGTLFRCAYSNDPVCTPFRGNLLTGQYSSHSGCRNNCDRIPAGARTLAAAFNDGGFRTSYVGKWHLGDKGNVPIPTELRGDFTDFIGYQCYNGFWRDVVFHDEAEQPVRFEKHRTEATTDLAIERLTRIADGPFAMFVSYQNPHYPVQPSDEFAAMYAGKPVTHRPNCREVDPFTATQSPRSPRPVETDPDHRRYGGDLDEYIRLYYAMVTQMDAQIGRLLDTLDELGLADSTAVVFTADHGDMQGSHGEINKCLPWEESAGIPLIVRVPGGAVGQVSDALVSGVDYFPTCLDFAGLPAEPSVDGVSFAPLTRGQSQTLEGPIFSERPNWWMVRQGRHKLVVRAEGQAPTGLFDLEADPYELANLVDNDAHADIRDRLHETVLNWRSGF